MSGREARPDTRECSSTGIDGLDDILQGGFTPDRMYLIEGLPGSGKTTLSLQFLLAGAARGEPVLYVNLSESAEEIHAVADSHGWKMDGLTIRELAAAEQMLVAPEEQYTVFHPSEVELTEATRAIMTDVEALRPRRVVIDSLSELRLLAGSPLRYRRQILAFKQFFAGRDCTVILLDDLSAQDRDAHVLSIVHGVISLEQFVPHYGSDRRRLRIVKFRGKSFRGGYHDYVIRRGGLVVFPRLVAAETRQFSSRARLSSGIAALDSLLDGGIERGTSTLIVGAAGTGKSTIASQFATAAAQRGERAALFVFDESMPTLIARSQALGIDLAPQVESGRVQVGQIDPAELSPGEFAARIRASVTEDNASIVVIDSLNGYLNSMPEERFLTAQLHELLSYLGQHGVATILIGAQQGLVGTNMVTPVEASYLADMVILLRYFEAEGEVRQAISVMKKRSGSHERTLREFHMGPGGLQLGEPLRGFRGVLTGVPVPLRSGPLRSGPLRSGAKLGTRR